MDNQDLDAQSENGIFGQTVFPICVQKLVWECDYVYHGYNNVLNKPLVIAQPGYTAIEVKHNRKAIVSTGGCKIYQVPDVHPGSKAHLVA